MGKPTKGNLHKEDFDKWFNRAAAMFSEVVEIVQVAQRRGQFQQLLKTQVILILNFTRIHCDSYKYDRGH